MPQVEYLPLSQEQEGVRNFLMVDLNSPEEFSKALFDSYVKNLGLISHGGDTRLSSAKAKFIVVGGKMFVFPEALGHISGLDEIRSSEENSRREVQCAGDIEVTYRHGSFGAFVTKGRTISTGSIGLKDNGTLSYEDADKYRDEVLRFKLAEHFTFVE